MPSFKFAVNQMFRGFILSLPGDGLKTFSNLNVSSRAAFYPRATGGAGLSHKL